MHGAAEQSDADKREPGEEPDDDDLASYSPHRLSRSLRGDGQRGPMAQLNNRAEKAEQIRKGRPLRIARLQPNTVGTV